MTRYVHIFPRLAAIIPKFADRCFNERKTTLYTVTTAHLTFPMFSNAGKE